MTPTLTTRFGSSGTTVSPNLCVTVAGKAPALGRGLALSVDAASGVVGAAGGEQQRQRQHGGDNGSTETHGRPFG